MNVPVLSIANTASLFVDAVVVVAEPFIISLPLPPPCVIGRWFIAASAATLAFAATRTSAKRSLISTTSPSRSLTSANSRRRSRISRSNWYSSDRRIVSSLSACPLVDLDIQREHARRKMDLGTTLNIQPP